MMTCLCYQHGEDPTCTTCLSSLSHSSPLNLFANWSLCLGRTATRYESATAWKPILIASNHSSQVSPYLKDWKNSLWGSNYEKLSKIKSKYDPNTLFWASPGVNADSMAVRQGGRLCRVTEMPRIEAGTAQPPDNGNINVANLLNRAGELFGGLGIWATRISFDEEDLIANVSHIDWP
jgi:Berberine and berberine like